MCRKRLLLVLEKAIHMSGMCIRPPYNGHTVIGHDPDVTMRPSAHGNSWDRQLPVPNEPNSFAHHRPRCDYATTDELRRILQDDHWRLRGIERPHRQRPEQFLNDDHTLRPVPQPGVSDPKPEIDMKPPTESPPPVGEVTPPSDVQTPDAGTSAATQSTPLTEAEKSAVKETIGGQSIPDSALTIGELDDWKTDPDLAPLSPDSKQFLAQNGSDFNGVAFQDADGKSYAFVDLTKMDQQAALFGVPTDIFEGMIKVQEVTHKNLIALYGDKISVSANEIIGDAASIKFARSTGNENAENWVANSNILYRLADEGSKTTGYQERLKLVENAQLKTLNQYIPNSDQSALTDFDNGLKAYLQNPNNSATDVGQAMDSYAEIYLKQQGVTGISGKDFMDQMRNNINMDIEQKSATLVQGLQAGNSV
jgi:hypothetical protein